MTTKSNTKAQTTVACPTCKKESVWSTANAYRPFCSERCKLIDLGEWASESYKVVATPDFDECDDFSSSMDPTQQPPGTLH